MAGKSKSSRFGAKARLILLSAAFATASLLTANTAKATTRHHIRHIGPQLAAAHTHTRSHTQYARNHRVYGAHVQTAEYRPHYAHYRSARFHYSGLQCVPYAREVSHIDLSGNAFLWWAEAAGRYDRGNAPVEGAVLNFRAIGRMPLGHVAVVTSVIDNRTILVTQANCCLLYTSTFTSANTGSPSAKAASEFPASTAVCSENAPRTNSTSITCRPATESPMAAGRVSISTPSSARLSEDSA